MTDRALLVFRVVLGAWLVGWFCNAPGFLENFRDALAFPIVYDGLPGVLRDPRLSVAAYVAPALAAPALADPTQKIARAAAALLAAAALFECFHMDTGSDATFITSFWTALWLSWFTAGAHRDDADFRIHARALAQGVVGLMFLGAAVGKLTPEFYSGEAFYRLYFRDNAGWPYPYLKARLEPSTVRGLATWFSRVAIGGELTLAAAPLLPTRLCLGLGSLAMLVMMLAWTFHLASVLTGLFGLLAAATLLDQGIRGEGAT